MGSENNVLHVEEKNYVVEEGENEEVKESAEGETDPTNCDEDTKVTTDLKDEGKEESVSKPIILTRAGCIEQKLREVEDAVENLMLNSPVRVTRGKLRKVISENDQTPAKC